MAFLSQSTHHHHFLSISQFNRLEIESLIQRGLFYLNALKNKTDIKPTLTGKTLLNCFFEASTRTQLSFERAAQTLDAKIINFNPSTSSLKKGESFFDTLKTLNAMQPTWISLRHVSPGAASLAAHCLDKSCIINAGDGSHEHPSQALLDSITLCEQTQKNRHKKKTAPLRILICGDILHSRVVRSQIKILTLLGHEIHLCAPPTLLPSSVKNWGVFVHTNLDQAIKDCHAIIILRVQKERMQNAFFPSQNEYFHFWGLTEERIKKAKPNALILHPGPVNRNVEICSTLLDQYPFLCIDQQVTAGVAARMSILEFLSVKTNSSPKQEDKA